MINGEYVTFRGRLKGGRIPAAGALVELQVRSRGKWRTFAQPRANAAPARWRYQYRFETVRGGARFRFRARVRRQAGYPLRDRQLAHDPRPRARPLNRDARSATSPCPPLSCGQERRSSSSEPGDRPMTHPLARLRGRLSYANVTATLALFIALGGTSYAAITLPRNSVGAKQIRAGAVRTHRDPQPRGQRSATSPTRTRSALRGQHRHPPGPAGPPGPAVTEHVQFNSAAARRGNARTGRSSGRTAGAVHRRLRATSAPARTRRRSPPCQAARCPSASAGRITVASAGGADVIVKTYDAAGNFVPQPFHLIVAC